MRLRDVYEYHKRKEYRKEIQIPLAHTGGDFYILCAALCFITEGWIAQGMDDIEPKEMAEAYMYLITRSMDDILSEL